MSLSLPERCDLLGPCVSMRDASRMTWLSNAFTERPGSQARLRRWVEAGRPAADNVQTLTYTGDDSILQIVQRVVATLPAPVRYHILRNVLVLGVGSETAGWQYYVPTLPGAHEAPLMVAVSGVLCDDQETFAGFVAHEFGHAWRASLFPIDTPIPISAPISAPVRVKPGAEGERACLSYHHEELGATILASEWGFRGPGANVMNAGRALRAVSTKLLEEEGKWSVCVEASK